MHPVSVREFIAERVVARRGRYHLFDRFDPKTTALVVIDMQNTFCEPGAPAEVPAARGVVANINRLASGLRKSGGVVIWVLHANVRHGERSDWDLFFRHFVDGNVRERTLASLAVERQEIWRDLDATPSDLVLTKNRYSALIPGSSPLERVLRGFGIDTVLIAGTKTNVCCESTARDAMMLDFKVVLVEDCCAALSDEEHRATLETVIQQFGDVLRADEVLERLVPGPA